MRIQTGCCDSTSQEARICRYIVRQSSVQSQDSSTSDLGKRWDTKPRQNGLTHVLRRPVESKPQCGTGRAAIASNAAKSPMRTFTLATRMSDKSPSRSFAKCRKLTKRISDAGFDDRLFQSLQISVGIIIVRIEILMSLRVFASSMHRLRPTSPSYQLQESLWQLVSRYFL